MQLLIRPLAHHLSSRPSSLASCLGFRPVVCLRRLQSVNLTTHAGHDDLPTDETVIRNPVGVQLLPRTIYNQVFPGPPFPPPEQRAIELSKDHLSQHALATDLSATIDPPLLQLPPLQGSTIDEHFTSLGIDRSEPYLSDARSFSSIDLPAIPSNWSQQPGWTIYHPDGSFEAIDHPPEHEKTLVMDVETLPAYTQCAVMAIAVSGSAWYSWLSPWLMGQSEHANQLIPMPSSRHRLIIGHHVGFDRARIQEEYTLQATRNRFIDTMSLHIATFGLSNPQRPAYLSCQKERQSRSESTPERDTPHDTPTGQTKDPSPPTNSRSGADHREAGKEAAQESWTDVASMNSLEEVAKLHCGIQLDKSVRNAFLEWDRPQIVSHLAHLLDYCARDVAASHAVYCKLLPIFLEQCPHPISFAGMLHMGNPFLPVDETWERFLQRSESTFVAKSSTIKASLLTLAEATRKLMFIKDPKTGRMIYEDDHWLKQLDWTPKKARWKSLHSWQESHSGSLAHADKDGDGPTNPKTIPAWYADLRHCNETHVLKIPLDSPLAAMLFKVRFDGHPVLYSRKLGWMFGQVSGPNGNQSEPMYRELNSSEIPCHIPLFERERVFEIPNLAGKSTKRVRTLLARSHVKIFASGTLTSPYPEAVLACQVSKIASVNHDEMAREVYGKLIQLAEQAKELEQQQVMLDPWLRQLDWTPVLDEVDCSPNEDELECNSSSPHPDVSSGQEFTPVMHSNLKSTKSSKAAKLREEDKVWPHWYWLLTRRGIDKIGLTTKSQMTPLLLRLSFCGFPLYRSREYGWTFRIPLDQLTEPYLSRKPLVFNMEREPLLFNDQDEAVYFKLPHPEGESENVGSPLSKAFDKAFESRILEANPLCLGELSLDRSSQSTNNTLKEADSLALADNARQALSMNMECSYWLNASQRIKDQMVVWQNDESKEPSVLERLEPSHRKQGVILPQVTVMGTITRRATEKTWLAAANAKKSKIGTELKSMVRAPPGFAIVGADVDSEELWISSVMGDAQFGMHGATAIGWMTLEGTKAAGTDLHSKTASILGISRNEAKVFNYSRIYGAGIAHAVQLLMKADPTASKEQATALAKRLYASTKGVKNYRGSMFGGKFWHGGTESYLFNKLEQIALAEHPQTPALDCGITRALRKCHLPSSGEGPDFMTSRVNWVVQSSGVDYLHMLIVAMDYLLDRYGISARYMISVHDEIRYLARWEDRHRCALALQIANLWTRCQFAFKLEMDDLPQSCAWFSAVDVDYVLRKEVDLTCETPSNPTAIPPGQSLDMAQLLALAPAGLGPLAKPLQTCARAPATATARQALRHRSTNLEWLAAQASQDKDEIKWLWNQARQNDWLRPRSLPRPATPARPRPPSPAAKDSPPPPTTQLPPSCRSTSRSPCAVSRQTKTKSSRLEDPDLVAWKRFDAEQSTSCQEIRNQLGGWF